jgi:hypothetical protein
MDYYVYAILDPRKQGIYNYNNYDFSFEPFYIGKGKDNRCYIHFINVKKKSLKNHRIKKILKEGYTPIVKIIKTNLTEIDAFEIEKELIKTIGRHDQQKGPLTNLTDGGDGTSGFKHTIEARSKIIKARKGKTYEEIYGKEKAMEERKKRSEKLKGQIRSKEVRIKISKTQKGRTYEQIYGKEKAAKMREIRSKARKGKTLKELYGITKAIEVQKKMSEVAKKRFIK